MTTATQEETGISAEELEAWLNGEIEKTCELSYTLFSGRWVCGRPATWLMYYKPLCNHQMYNSCFLCDNCQMIAKYSPAGITCSSCSKSLDIRFIERIR